MKAFLHRLAAADFRGTSPAEGFYCFLALLESFASHRTADLGSGSLDAHRLFFPLLGTSREAQAKREMRDGTFVAPPPMHPFFAASFEMIVVNDHAGSDRARKFGSDDHAVGLARCFLAGALPGTPGAAYGFGSGLAALTHRSSAARALGGLLAVLAHHVLRGASPREAFEATVIQGSMLSGSAFDGLCQAMGMGEVDGTPVADSDLLRCAEVARVLGRATSGKTLVAYGAKARVALHPLVAPLVEHGTPTLPNGLSARILAAVDAAAAAGVIVV